MSVAERFRRRRGVIETALGDELILLDPATQEMFSLNATGRVIWRALDDVPLDALIARVVETFEVETAAADADVRALLKRLEEARLVEPA